ncbi:MAG: uncharacterized protein A8A55_1573 [Amphiamblys sp. WSBS2006]|nr:MAG: uncharacterized protein A8A55_1573 [Amphiamblys sp. WSBS2006]
MKQLYNNSSTSFLEIHFPDITKIEQLVSLGDGKVDMRIKRSGESEFVQNIISIIEIKRNDISLEEALLQASLYAHKHCFMERKTKMYMVVVTVSLPDYYCCV